MTREEYRRWLAYEVRRGNLDAATAAELLRRFDAGEIAGDSLMLDAETVLRMAREPAVEERDRTWLLLLAALGLLAAGRLRRVGARLALHERRRLRDNLRRGWLLETVRLAAELAASGAVARWQMQMGATIRDYYMRQYMAGAGRALSEAETATLEARLRTQMAYLARFGADVHARAAMGQPYGAGYVAGRSELYGGGAWGLWHSAVDAEYAEQPGWVVDYVAVDDGHTCRDCRAAAALGPYLPGAAPLPGLICQGGSRCRCTLAYRWAPETYRRVGEI